MSRNKPKHKRPGGRRTAGPDASRASDKTDNIRTQKAAVPPGAAGRASAQKAGASGRAGVHPVDGRGRKSDKVVPLRRRGRERQPAAPTGGRPSAVAVPARLLRLVPPSLGRLPAAGLARIGSSAAQAWQRLLAGLGLRHPPGDGRPSGDGRPPGEDGRGGAAGRKQSTATREVAGPGRGARPKPPAPATPPTPRFKPWAVGAAIAKRWPSLPEFRRRTLASLKELLAKAATFDGLMAVLLAVMIFYPPYLRGLFFTEELLPTHMLTAAVFALFAFHKLMRGELAFFERPLDYAVFVLLGLYVTCSIGAWNVHDAILGVLKMANYAAIYWLLAHSVRSLSAVRGYLGVLLASGAGVSLLGWGTAIGTFSYPAAFVGGRLSSSLQYPNTLASFMTAINLFGLYLWNEYRRHQVLGSLLAVVNYLLFLAILGSQSRGALLIYPVGLVLLLAGLGRERWRTLGLFAMQLAASLAVIGMIMTNADAHAHTPAIQLHGWLWLLGGAALVVLFHLAWLYYTDLAPRWRAGASAGGARRAAGSRRRPWVAAASIALVLVILAGAGFGLWRERAAVRALAAKAAPSALLQRLGTISTGDINLLERVSYSRDALKIMTSSPLNALLGAGGGGWNAIYHKFQSYLYFSTEVHDHFLQVGVETGFPGLIDFLLIWGFFIATAWSIYRFAKPGDRLKTPEGVPAASWAILSAAVALGIHSAIDFNLSLGAVSLLLYGLFGLERGLERLYGPAAAARAAAAEAAAAMDKQARKRYHRRESSSWKMPPALKGTIVGVLAAAFFFIPLVLEIGIQYAQAGAKANQDKDLQGAISNYGQAISHDISSADYRALLANAYWNQVQQDQQQAGNSQSGSQASQYDDADMMAKALDAMSVAVRLNRGDASLHTLYAEILYYDGKVIQGLSELQTAAALQPMARSSYDDLATGYFEAGKLLLEQASQAGASDSNGARERQQGEGYLKQILALPKLIQDRAAGITPAEKKLWAPDQPLLTVSAVLELEEGKADLLLGNAREASACLTAALQDSSLDTSLKPEAQLYQGLSLKQQGKAAEGQALIDQALKAKSSLKQELSEIRPILQPQAK